MILIDSIESLNFSLNTLKSTLQTTNKSIEKKIKELEERINTFKTTINKEIEDNKKWKPELQEFYWTIDWVINKYKVIETRWLNDNLDRFRYNLFGWCFKTKEEADFELERLEVIAEMKEFTYEFSNDEWESNDINKYFLYLNKNNNIMDWDCNTDIQRNDLYFKSYKDIQTCIDTVGEDRIKKYYFKLGL